MPYAELVRRVAASREKAFAETTLVSKRLVTTKTEDHERD
jgi:hypothetical protein